MIDIVKVLRDQHPDLGSYVIALRERSGLVAPDDPDALAAEVRDWAGTQAPTTRYSRRAVTYVPFPGWPEETRTLGVVAFDTATDLARFATRWT
ncbi:hypothetical protein SAMN04487843_10939 [Methylobacterium sp. ap11]|uniref:hypothetical protein n=1 Tax=Methylobacterium sp. ap11 TaxID=1761799 RepID=UPI0008C2C13D|nr:hypothetical protein [Methylobacterium sp. ap11]SEP24291.1 hypothetical protein SAMN04487843_10939 [Methylobacterium sp. ap11]